MTKSDISTRRDFLTGSAAFAAGVLLSPAWLFAADPMKVTLGTATPGGGFQLYGGALAKAVAEANTGLVIDEVPTKGSGANLKRLRAGELDFGQVEGNAAHRAFEAQKDKDEKLKIAAAMYPGPGMFVLRGDNPANSIDDLKGKKIIYGTEKSGLTILVKTVLAGLGYDPEKDFIPVYLDKAKDGPPKLLAGEAEAYWGGGFGWPGFEKVAAGGKGAKFLVPGRDGVSRIREKFPYLAEMEVPRGSYPGIAEDLVTVGMWSFILTRPGLPDEAAYKFARAVHKAGPQLAAELQQGAYTTPENTARYAPDGLLHPGAASYLREIGALP